MNSTGHSKKSSYKSIMKQLTAPKKTEEQIKAEHKQKLEKELIKPEKPKVPVI